ncbi:unnamed protein product [Rotaria sordida]|uniref:Cap-specific mRNA (nucleoside-2'-O-)-methyltransferase 1 n=1 Tax=Rotaria sordida TaxID=392033 RepID=A0A815WF51_9BILA|nr:unnamed protein product [Rotaria sordida]
MVDNDRFIIETLDRWYFGVDNSGNILDTNNIKGLWNKIRFGPKLSGVHLVTGDGSVDASSDPNEQESIVSELHYAEAVCAMGALAKGGSLVLKMFNLFECETICLLYILALHFKELSIFKPASSRAPNAETYIVAIGFRGIAPEVLNSLLSLVSPTFPHGKSLLSRESIPPSFLKAVIEIADYFTNKQIQALERNLDLEQKWNRNVQQAVWQLNQDIARDFRRECLIDKNPKIQRIVADPILDGSAKALGNSASQAKGGLRARAGGTLEDRQDRKRKREEFLTTSDTGDGDNKNEDDEEGPKKKRNLGHGSSIIVGRKESLRASMNDTNEMEVELSDIQQRSESAATSWAKKILEKSGFVEGQGLGRDGQGRTTPIEAAMAQTHLGFGHQDRLSMQSSSFSAPPSVPDEPLFLESDKPISAHPSALANLVLLLDRQPITSSSNLRSVLSSLFVKFDDLELFSQSPTFQKYLADTAQRLLRREVQALDKRLWHKSHTNYQKTDPFGTDDIKEKAFELIFIPRHPIQKPVEPDSGITLPEGWSKEWSRSNEQFYYFNQNTGESRWEPPKHN